MLKLAWGDIVDTVTLLRRTGWGLNVDLVADIWAGAAAILEEQRNALPLMIEAALSGPNLPATQLAVETTATLIHEFDTALQANDRRPDSDDKILRRTALLHFSGRHSVCVDFFESKGSKASRTEPMFGTAAAMAIRSAEKLVRPELVELWTRELGSDPEFARRRAIIEYFRTIERSLLEKDTALETLQQQYQTLIRPLELAMLLLMEMDPSDHAAAEQMIEIGDRIMTERLLPPDLSLCYCQALAKLDRWSKLLDYTRDTLRRVGAKDRIKAVEALALDKLGRTPEAMESLRELLEAGSRDRFAINTYINIVMRCGLEKEAIGVAESIVGNEKETDRKIEALRLLFVLVYHSDPTSLRAVEIAWRVGELVDQKIEEQEGLFLMLMFSATLRASLDKNDPRIPAFQTRMSDFIKRFPQSRILKSVAFPTQASGAQIIALIRRETGWSEEREKNRRRLENQLQRGELPIPIAWRPKAVLLNVPDVPTLWEIGKRDRTRERAYQLIMADENWQPRSARDIQRMPLIDLITLLVLQDLGILPLLFKVFDRIAIAQATLHELTRLLSPMSSTPARAQCLSLRNELKAHLTQIAQPAVPGTDSDELIGSRSASEQIRVLVAAGHYELYSDDLFFRIYCLEQGSRAGVCTLDFLRICEEKGLLSSIEVAEKYALLFSWNVGLRIELRDQLAVLPEGLAQATSLGEAVDMMRASAKTVAVFDAIWDLGKSMRDLRLHASAVLRNTIGDSRNSLVSISALLAFWFGKVRLHPDVNVNPELILAQLIAAGASPASALKPQTATRLWSVYFALIEFHHGKSMDQDKEKEAIRRLAALCAGLDSASGEFADNSYRRQLGAGLESGTANAEIFLSGYYDALSSIVKAKD